MSKLDQLKALGDAKRVSRTKVPSSAVEQRSPKPKVSGSNPEVPAKSKGFRIKTLPSVEPIGDGVALTSMAHPPGLIDEIAGAIRSGKLKSTPECPVCAARRQARAAAQKKWRRQAKSKGEME